MIYLRETGGINAKGLKLHNATIIIECSHSDLLFSTVFLACENIHIFSSLDTAGDVSHGGTSATQRQKFHTDDVINVYIYFTFLLVDFGKVLSASANERQQNSNASSREDYIPQILAVLFKRFIVFTFDLCGLLSFVCHS